MQDLSQGTDPSQEAASDAEDVVALLERDAAALRRGRRLHRRFMLAYFAFAAVFIGWVALHLAPDVAAWRTPTFEYPGSLAPPVPAEPIPNPFESFEARTTPAPSPTSRPEAKVIPIPTDLSRAQPATPPPNAQVSPPPLVREWLDPRPFGLIIAMTALVLIGGLRMLSRQKRAAGSLTRFDDVRAVGPLAEALAVDDPGVRRLVCAALTRLLPRLRASDSELLNDGQHATLNRALAGPQIALTLAILNAYEQVGDHRDLAAVERLAGSTAKAAQDQRVQRGVARCLPALRERSRLHVQSQRLLRASAAETANDALLRPALASPSCDADVLPRPLEL